MVPTTSSTVSVERISTPGALLAFVNSLVGLPNNPASLYLSVSSRSLIIYIAPSLKVNLIDLSHLSVALRQGNDGASALKNFLETGQVIKVFFDARMTAKVLFDGCGIKLATENCTRRAYIHEVQMMEIALRQNDADRELLAGLDKCIIRDSDLDIYKLIPDSLDGSAGFDTRILYLPVLWKKYHDQLVSGRFGFGGSFWIARIREATQKRLGVSCGERHIGYDVNSARSGWDEDIIEEQSDSWNNYIEMDGIYQGEDPDYAAHLAQFNLL